MVCFGLKQRDLSLQIKYNHTFPQSPASVSSVSPWDVTFHPRCTELLGVWEAEPADRCFLQGVPDLSLLAWSQRLQPAGADWACCWSAGWPTHLQGYTVTNIRTKNNKTKTKHTRAHNRDVHMLLNMQARVVKMQGSTTKITYKDILSSSTMKRT